MSYQQLYFIEMRKFNKEWHELGSLLDRWIAFLNKATELGRHDIPPALQTEEEIVKAINRLDIMSFEEKEREIYEAELKSRRDEIEAIRTATEKGKAEGMSEALQRMVAHGIPEEEARCILGIN